MAALTPEGNFTVAEFQAKSDRTLTAADIEHARQLATMLEVVRRVLGVRLPVTSYIRTGSAGQHGDGTGVDAEPVGHKMTQRNIIDRVSAAAEAGALGTFGQLIFYPFSDEHIHLSLPTGRHRNAIYVANAAEDHYERLTPAVLATIPGSVVVSLAGLVLVGSVAYWALSGRGV
jgi:hypothetical protein